MERSAIPPEDLAEVQRVGRKRLGAALLFLVVFVALAVPLRGRFAFGGWGYDVLGAAGLIAISVGYSRAMALTLLACARRRAERNEWPAVLALLSGYLPGRGWLPGRSRFDPTGEAHYLLARAGIETDQPEAAAYGRWVASRYRRGDWAEKARKLKIPTQRVET